MLVCQAYRMQEPQGHGSCYLPFNGRRAKSSNLLQTNISEGSPDSLAYRSVKIKPMPQWSPPRTWRVCHEGYSQWIESTVVVTRLSNVWFYQKRLGSRYCGKSLLAQRSRESTQLTLLHSWHPIFSTTAQTDCPSFLVPVHPSIHPPDFLLLSMVFFLCSLPANWLLAPSMVDFI